MRRILMLLSLIFVLIFSSCEKPEHIVEVHYIFSDNVDTFYVRGSVYLYEGNLKNGTYHTLASGVRTFRYIK